MYCGEFVFHPVKEEERFASAMRKITEQKPIDDAKREEGVYESFLDNAFSKIREEAKDGKAFAWLFNFTPHHTSSIIRVLETLRDKYGYKIGCRKDGFYAEW